MSEDLSYAGKLSETLSDLLMKRKPRYGYIWGRTFNIDTYDVASPNQQEGANGCEILAAFDRGDMATVERILDWQCGLAERPFMRNEPMSPEPVYRVLTAYGSLAAAGVASRVSAPVHAITRKLPRSHFFWLLLGISNHSGRIVVDHHWGDSDGCILVGTKKPKDQSNHVSCAGARAWIRAGKTTRSDFQFTENPAVRVIVAQGLGRKYRQNVEIVQRDMMAGFISRFGLNPWCMTNEELSDAMAFASDLTSDAKAESISSYLLAPMIDYGIDRYENEDVVTYAIKNNPSSTDFRMLDASYHQGETQQASCSDGIRSTKEPQHVELETDAYRIHRDDESSELRVPRPYPNLAWSVTARGGKIAFDDAEPESMIPMTPSDKIPADPSPRHRGGFFGFS